MNNAVLETIAKRRSIRAYTAEQISEKQLEALINAALISPTAMNSQLFHFSVIQNKELLLDFEKDIINYFIENKETATVERIKSRNNKVLFDAPTFIVISSKPTGYEGINAGIAVQSIALAAKSMGLESVILGLPKVPFMGQNTDKWRETFKLPEGYEFTISIAIGYGNMEGNEREIDRSKFTLIK